MTERGAASAILVVHVSGRLHAPEAGWQSGPASFDLPQSGDAGQRYFYRKQTDRVTRSEFMRMQVTRLLYGTPRDTRRQSKPLGEGVGLGGGQVSWIEVLELPVGPTRSGGSLLAIHLDLGADVSGKDLLERTSFLGNLRDVSGGFRTELREFVEAHVPGVFIADNRFAYVITHWVPDSLTDSPIAGLPASTGWARAIAAANPAFAASKSLQQPDPAFEVQLSNSWLASVLNAGAAFVGTSGQSDPFHSIARVLVHSVYLDALLLAMCQEQGVDYLAAEVGDLWESGRSVSALTALERDALRFRSEVWWTDISPTIHVNRILRRFQDERDLPQREGRLRSDVDDMVAYATARRVDRTNSLLTLFVIAGFGAGGAALIAEPGGRAVAWGIGLALFAWVVMKVIQSRSKRW